MVHASGLEKAFIRNSKTIKGARSWAIKVVKKAREKTSNNATTSTSKKERPGRKTNKRINQH
ncbi:MAG: hypothetical protein ACI8ZB_004411 [Desulforhopalus sp.]|jgi:hypothetical protein